VHVPWSRHSTRHVTFPYVMFFPCKHT
jgi:hypothetical protein